MVLYKMVSVGRIAAMLVKLLNKFIGLRSWILIIIWRRCSQLHHNLITCWPLWSLLCLGMNLKLMGHLPLIFQRKMNIFHLFCTKQSNEEVLWPQSCFPQTILTSYAFRSSEFYKLLLELDSYGGTDPQGLFFAFFKECRPIIVT